MEERIQNILSHAGVASRRHAADLVAAGRVCVDGVVVREPYLRFDPEKAQVTVDGRPVAVAERKRTVMLYKPVGVLSTMHDPFGGRTVADIVKGRIPERVVPVGRLDQDSEGLLLMSNDGDLAFRLTHPRFEHEKTYLVRTAGRWDDGRLRALRSSLEMPDGYRIRPAQVELLDEWSNGVQLLEFRLREGRKRQIRNMCRAAGLKVLALKRVAIGALRLPREMRPGEWRDLSPSDLRLLDGSVSPAAQGRDAPESFPLGADR